MVKRSLTVAAILLATAFSYGTVQAQDSKPANKNKGAFIKTSKSGKKFLLIRITPKQWASVKVRSKLKGKKGIVRIVLGPKQVKAARAAVGKEVKKKKVTLRTRAKRVRRLKSKKGFWLVRPAKQFEKDDPSDAEEGEPEDAGEEDLGDDVEAAEE